MTKSQLSRASTLEVLLSSLCLHTSGPSPGPLCAPSAVHWLQSGLACEPLLFWEEMPHHPSNVHSLFML